MLTASVIDIQRGFVPSRQLAANVLDLDTFSRWYGAAGHECFDLPDMASSSGTVDPAATSPIVRVAPKEALKIKKERKGGTQERLKVKKGGAQESLKEIKRVAPKKALRKMASGRENHILILIRSMILNPKGARFLILTILNSHTIRNA